SADLFPGSCELLARRARAELAVAEVGHPEVFEIPVKGGRVGLDRVGGDPELARPMTGSAPEVDRAFEGNAEDDEAGRRVGRAAGGETGVGRLSRGTRPTPPGRRPPGPAPAAPH